jgi:hypothetical protein
MPSPACADADHRLAHLNRHRHPLSRHHLQPNEDPQAPMRVTRRPQSEVFLTASRGDYRHTAEDMQHREDEHPVVRCPGCQQPMEPKERTSVTDRLVDIRYVCATCSMDTKRTVKEA